MGVRDSEFLFELLQAIILSDFEMKLVWSYFSVLDNYRRLISALMWSSLTNESLITIKSPLH